MLCAFAKRCQPARMCPQRCSAVSGSAVTKGELCGVEAANRAPNFIRYDSRTALRSPRPRFPKCRHLELLYREKE
jgi:hypothetical protein